MPESERRKNLQSGSVELSVQRQLNLYQTRTSELFPTGVDESERDMAANCENSMACMSDIPYRDLYKHDSFCIHLQ